MITRNRSVRLEEVSNCFRVSCTNRRVDMNGFVSFCQLLWLYAAGCRVERQRCDGQHLKSARLVCGSSRLLVRPDSSRQQGQPVRQGGHRRWCRCRIAKPRNGHPPHSSTARRGRTRGAGCGCAFMAPRELARASMDLSRLDADRALGPDRVAERPSSTANENRTTQASGTRMDGKAVR